MIVLLTIPTINQEKHIWQNKKIAYLSSTYGKMKSYNFSKEEKLNLTNDEIKVIAWAIARSVSP